MPRRTSTTSSLNLVRGALRQGSETPSQEGNKSSSPSLSTGTASSLNTAAYHAADLSFSTSVARTDWSHLPPDFRNYLNYFCENITHHHYCMVSDADDFVRGILPNIAVRNEALLNAIVGFSAYHVTLKNPNGKVKDFLQYYNKSVRLLLNFLKRREKHNIATLLTILQLATIEVTFPVFLIVDPLVWGLACLI
jgi:hypothetical protein